MPASDSITDYDKLWADIYGDLQEIGPTHRHMKRIMRRFLGQIEYNSLLDVGCGFGHNLSLLCEGRNLQSVAGIDISRKAVEYMRRSVCESFHQLDIQKERLEGTWELVFSSLLLEHVPDDMAALRNMRAMTSKYLLVSTMSGSFERYRPWEEKIGHVRNYRIGELESKLEQTGFTVEQAVYWGSPFFSPIARIFQNHMAPKKKMGITGRVLAGILYLLYFLNSYRKGDLLIILAHV